MPYPSDAPPPANPGEPGYEAYKAYWAAHPPTGKTTSGDDNAGSPGTRPGPAPAAPQTGGGGGFNPGGEGDPARTSAYGNQSGFGDGSKFQADFQKGDNQFHQGIADVWNQINGAYDPANVQMNQQIGQTGPTAQSGSTMFAQGPDGTQQNQSRDMQMSLIQQLQDRAAGRGPSLAQMQLQKGTDQNIAQAMALGSSQRGAGQAGMMKGIQGQQANIAQGMSGDAAMMALQEQNAAQAMLGGQLNGVRGQDQSFAGMGMQNNQFNAGAGNQNNQFNAGQQNTMMNNNAQRASEMAQAQAKLDMEREKMKQEAAAKRSPVGAIGGFASALSDERLKTDIEDGDSKLYDFLDKLSPHEYRYKDEKHGVGRRISPMAQELEKSELGEAFVFEHPDGKAVDYGKGLGTILAAQAALHKRLKKIGA